MVEQQIRLIEKRDSSFGLTAMGIFLVFAAAMAALARATLLWRGTFLDPIWTLNRAAYRQLEPLGGKVGFLFLLLSITLGVAANGWFRRRVWGWRLAVFLIGTQIAGDLVSILMGEFARGSAGVALAGLFMFYVLRPQGRDAFRRGESPTSH
ncbi:MAG: hypothetical protein WAN12_03555 [Candidatus Acidiferrum sp.]